MEFFDEEIVSEFSKTCRQFSTAFRSAHRTLEMILAHKKNSPPTPVEPPYDFLTCAKQFALTEAISTVWLEKCIHFLCKNKFRMDRCKNLWECFGNPNDKKSWKKINNEKLQKQLNEACQVVFEEYQKIAELFDEFQSIPVEKQGDWVDFAKEKCPKHKVRHKNVYKRLNEIIEAGFEIVPMYKSEIKQKNRKCIHEILIQLHNESVTL